MHCQFLVISPLLIFGREDTYQFNIIKPFKAGSTNHYLRYEGSPKTSYQIPEGVTGEEVRNTSKNHIIYKFCAERKENLLSLENHFEANTHRKSDVIIDSRDEDSSYKECSEKINSQLVGITLLSMSAISKNRLPPCTTKMLIRDISYRRAKAYGAYKIYSHQASAKIILEWDEFIPLHELLDQKDPLMTKKRQGQLTHLVYIAGFLKLATEIPDKKGYKISPALGNPPENEIYEFLDKFKRHRTFITFDLLRLF
ncbi:BgTH12-05133 [Blumeria graminis f. sp. triticale]|uniref:Bgt-51959 n=2 Tax=Blumeria graminis TaxID=34373 RepID=A0A9X9MH36_BLUGR|nr:BgTH12-05133 [Blumeria graminis f. sp. triticale]VDB87928.1 Bgt-51959 [Blumeria graminis f. sp. tritici]